MLLKTITLNNIRSYTHQVVYLSEGSTLLAGDIGCGKSSLLLAIEFALFGTSRPDLPAESLLRKGELSGSVELNFSLFGQEISIKRNLKKDKNSIKQTSGHIIKNGIKTELTAVELKAEIIHLLGYPEEFIEKNKNYIFRFTVYTPQEEMKFILHEEPEIRLDVIRKIFNLEKYRMVRENVQLILKQMRVSLTLFKTKLENSGEKKDNLKQLEVQINELQDQILKQQQPLQETIGQIALKRSKLERLETIQKERQELVLEKTKISALIQEKNNFLTLLLEKKDSINKQLNQLELSKELVEETISSEIRKLEHLEKTRVSTSSKLQERLIQLRLLIQNFQQEIQSLELRLSNKNELDQKITEHNWIIKDHLKVKEQLMQLEQSLEMCRASIIQNKTIIATSKDLKVKILNLDHCPTCLQEVSLTHKQNINRKENEIIKETDILLGPLEQQKNSLLLQLESLKLRLTEIHQKEQFLVKLQTELLQWEETTALCTQKKEKLKQLVQENNAAIKELQIVGQEPSWREKIDQLQEIKLNLSKRKMLEKSKLEIELQHTALQELVQFSEQKLIAVVAALASKTDQQEEILNERTEYLFLKDKETEYSLKIIESKTNLANIIKNKEHLEKELNYLKNVELEQIKLQETYHWLEIYFLPLTVSIEKQVMTHIHNLFNEMFQEWFTILINNEQITARLDDLFTPVIEQNGYEISFSNLSGGEKTAASLAYRLSLNRVINDVISQIKTKDILILDEPTDGFSNEQLDRVREVLERLQLRQTIIVSHESKIESFVENVIRISKDEQKSIVSV